MPAHNVLIEREPIVATATRQLLYSRRSAAKALDVSVRMIDYAIASGLLEIRHVNSRVLIPFDSLTNFAASDRIVSKGEGVTRA